MFDLVSSRHTERPMAVDDDQEYMDYEIYPTTGDERSTSNSIMTLSGQFERYTLEPSSRDDTAPSPPPNPFTLSPSPPSPCDWTNTAPQPRQPTTGRRQDSAHFLKIHFLVQTLLSDEPGFGHPTLSESPPSASATDSAPAQGPAQASSSSSNQTPTAASESEEYSSRIFRFMYHRASKDGRPGAYKDGRLSAGKDRKGKQDCVLKTIRCRKSCMKGKAPRKSA